MLSALSGPLAVYGYRNPPSALGSNNPDAAPSSVFAGFGLLDVRAGYNVTRRGVLSIGSEYFRTLSYAPAVIALNNIAAAANVASGVAMTLVSTTGAGINVLATALQVWASGNIMPVGTPVIDAAQTLVGYGLADPAGLKKSSWYNYATTGGRAVSITGVSGGAGGTFVVRGWDVYGYPMTENLVNAGGATTISGKKAFKYIKSVTPSFTDAHNYSVGTTDIFGFPLCTNFFHDCFVWMDDTLITAKTGFVAAVATDPATATTGDVRGTYALQTASDGTKILTFANSLSAAAANTVVGQFGVAQFSN